MKRGWIFLGLLVLGLAACQKDPNDPSHKTPSVYTPTPVDPTTIFPVGKFGMPPLPSDNPFTQEGIYLGRMLFYDPILSYDSSISCGSCHKQEYAFAEPKKIQHGHFRTANGTKFQFVIQFGLQQKILLGCPTKHLAGASI